MIEPQRSPVPASFGMLPAPVLVLGPDGIVQASNGWLDERVGHAVTGRAIAELLDAESSGAKWERLLARTPTGEERDRRWELIFRGEHGLLEPIAVAIVQEPGSEELWLVGSPTDPRLERLSEELSVLNSELTSAQRNLLKERGRLAQALGELEEQYATVQRLVQTVQAQNRELERSNEALDEFAHVISHDLKAPLRGIQQYTEWIASDPGAAQLGEQSRGHLSRLVDRVQRMRSMIDGVLTYARAGRERGPLEEIAVDELLAETLTLLDPPARVAVEIDGPMPALYTDRAPLRQVFLNLIGNAIRYAGRSDAPCVRIGARAEGALFRFEVADNGPGIPPRLQDRIWGLFKTLEPEERAEGTGVGLAIVRKLVEAHGGTVGVDSSPGAGAAFHFSWPVRPEARE